MDRERSGDRKRPIGWRESSQVYECLFQRGSGIITTAALLDPRCWRETGSGKRAINQYKNKLLSILCKEQIKSGRTLKLWGIGGQYTEMEETWLKCPEEMLPGVRRGPEMGVPAQVTALSGQTWGAPHLTLSSQNSAPEKILSRGWI